jgi:hypothetical protein
MTNKNLCQGIILTIVGLGWKGQTEFVPEKTIITKINQTLRITN